jgi:hypothetical protein
MDRIEFPRPAKPAGCGQFNFAPPLGKHRVWFFK